MTTRWRYRLASVLGVTTLTALAVVVANHPLAQRFVTAVPPLRSLPPETYTNGALVTVVLTTVLVVLVAAWPLHKPRQRRILDTAMRAEKRVLLAVMGLATIGYFDYTYQLPRSTLVATGVLLAMALPAWYLLIGRRPAEPKRAIVVGDDRDAIAETIAATSLEIVGVVAPKAVVTDEKAERPTLLADGAGTNNASPRGTGTVAGVPHVGGLSRLEEVLGDANADAALLAFGQSDRAEFFGSLDACHRHGLPAMVHRDHADSVLTEDDDGGDLLPVDLEPWDWQDHLLKRVFDVAFAGIGLLVLAPVMAAIAVAIELDDGGPILYSQERTAAFGDTFTVSKFRTMRPGGADEAPGEEHDRVTDVGAFLRRTHLDEIPQLWAILIGDMSVVGPRAAWTDEETLLQDQVTAWPQRWFVKPGLTGLAQINDATSEQPRRKLRYDVAYIRRQSVRVDLRIVIRQLWQVGCDLVGRGAR